MDAGDAAACVLHALATAFTAEKIDEIEMVAPTVGARTGAVPRRRPLAVSAVSSFVPV